MTKNQINNYLLKLIKESGQEKIILKGRLDFNLINLIKTETSSLIYCDDVCFLDLCTIKYINNVQLDEEKALFLKCNKFSKLNLNYKSDLDFISILYVIDKNIQIFQKENEHNKRLTNNLIANTDYFINQFKNNVFSSIKTIEKSCSLDESILDSNVLYVENLKNESNKLDKMLGFKKLKKYNYDVLNFIKVTKNKLDELKKFCCLKQKSNLFIYTNLTSKKYLIKNRDNRKINFYKEIGMEDIIGNILISELDKNYFYYLREKYISKKIKSNSCPQLILGLFSDNKIFGVLGFCNDYIYKISKDYEYNSIYMLTDFALPYKKEKRLGKLVVMIAKSNEVKRLLEKFIKRKLNYITTNVFTKNHSSMKYRNDYKLINKKYENNLYNLTYLGEFRNKTKKEIKEQWIQKLSK